MGRTPYAPFVYIGSMIARMGFLDWLGLRSPEPAVLSPWTPDPSPLSPLVPLAEVLALGAGLSDLPLTRDDAMKVPAVARGRNLIVSAATRLAMNAYRGATVLPGDQQPTWTYRTDGTLPIQTRQAMTVDDGLFYGRSLWALKRGADGTLLDSAWITPRRWTITDSAILVDEKPVDAEQVCYFDWPGWPGLLAAASRTLRGSTAIEEAWVARARTPIPAMWFEPTDGYDLEQDEIDDTLAAWRTARRDPDGLVGYVPTRLKLNVEAGTASADLFDGARNGNRVDLAGFLGLPATLLDGSVAAASLTYQTEGGARDRFYGETLPQWLGPIEARLSQDDIVPRGQRIRFDFPAPITAEGADQPSAPVED